jgi:hypothetical protein
MVKINDINRSDDDDNADSGNNNNNRGIVVGANRLPSFFASLANPSFSLTNFFKVNLSLNIRLQQSDFLNGSLTSLSLISRRRMQQSDILSGGFPKLRMIYKMQGKVFKI